MWNKTGDRSIHYTMYIYISPFCPHFWCWFREERWGKKANILFCNRVRVLLAFLISADWQCPLYHHCWNIHLCGLQVCSLGCPVELPQYSADSEPWSCLPFLSKSYLHIQYGVASVFRWGISNVPWIVNFRDVLDSKIISSTSTLANQAVVTWAELPRTFSFQFCH